MAPAAPFTAKVRHIAEKSPKDVTDLSVSELRARASELEITGRSLMNRDELLQAVEDAELQTGTGASAVTDRQGDEDVEDVEDVEGDEGDEDGGADAEKPASGLSAPSIGPNTELDQFKEPPEERLKKHEQSTIDAMGLDKRREVMGEQYGASALKQATVYGIALAVTVAVVIGAKLAADELDQGPAVDEDQAPWSQPDAQQRPPEPIDFPRNPSP